MNITIPVFTTNSNVATLRNKRPSFEGDINGIIVSDKTEKVLNKLSDTMKVVIGNEIHNTTVKVGNKKALYNMFSNDFEIKLDDHSSLSILTDHGKIHSIFGIEKTKNKKNGKLIRSFSLYNGCHNAEKPIPSINYNECRNVNTKFKIENYTYKPGDKIPNDINALLTSFINSIFKKLGI